MDTRRGQAQFFPQGLPLGLRFSGAADNKITANQLG